MKSQRQGEPRRNVVLQLVNLFAGSQKAGSGRYLTPQVDQLTRVGLEVPTQKSSIRLQSGAISLVVRSHLELRSRYSEIDS